MKYYSELCKSDLVKSTLLVFFLSLLTACGGGAGGGDTANNSSSAKQDEPAPPEPTYLSGTAVKGTISFGNVDIYTISAGSKGSLLVSTTTDANGNYSATLPGTYQGPVLIEIYAKADGSSRMTCDSASGCGNFIGISELDVNENGTIDFGENFPLQSGFTLKALLPSSIASQTNVNVDVTILTHLATAYAESFPQGFDNLSAELAITQVANLFALNQNPFTINAPSINDLDSFRQASEAEKFYGLIASSVANLGTSEDLIQIIDQLTDHFTLNSGQLINNSGDNNVITLKQLLQASIDNLTTVNNLSQEADYDSLSNQLSSLFTDASNAGEDSLTNAEGSPTSGSSELEKVQQFLADLQAWQGVISVTTAEQAALINAYDSVADVSEFHSPMVQAMALASQHSAIVAVPDLAIKAACDSLGNAFVVLLCDSMIANLTIEEICDATLNNLTLFGVSLCDFLNDLTLPVGHGLWANYAIYDGTARVFGTLEGTDIDISFTNSRRSGKTIRFDISGAIGNDNGEVNLDGRITFNFADTLNSSTIAAPKSASLQFDLASDFDTELGVMLFDGDLTGTVRLDDIAGNGQTGLEGVNYNLTLSGDLQFNANPSLAGEITLTNKTASGFRAAMDITNADFTETARLSFSDDTNFGLSWSGRSYQFNYVEIETEAESPELQLQVSNQDNVAMIIGLDKDSGEAGNLTINEANYANITWLNQSLLFTLPDNSETILYQ